MKRTILMSIAAAAVVCLFSSCSEKEGVYSPKKQISKVYESSTSIYQFWSDGGWINDTNVQPKTLAEFKDMLIAFRDQDANGNGDPGDEIPWTGAWDTEQSERCFILEAYG